MLDLGAAKLQKLDPQMQVQTFQSQGEASSSKASGLAWAESEQREKEASQAKIAAGPKLAANRAQTNVHKVAILMKPHVQVLMSNTTSSLAPDHLFSCICLMSDIPESNVHRQMIKTPFLKFFSFPCPPNACKQLPPKSLDAHSQAQLFRIILSLLLW